MKLPKILNLKRAGKPDKIGKEETEEIEVLNEKEDTDLPFLIHGSFETAVSREKLMTPSKFNDDLFDELGNLIADSLLELADRKMITQAFIRNIILVAFEDETNNGTILGLTEKIRLRLGDSELAR